MITTGVTGGSWRADVTAWGAVEPWDGSPPLDWFVAADDRWHAAAREPAVRQRRVAGTPVVETRMRIPSGDAVHRVFSVADAGGLTIVEVENDSALPIAVAFTGRDGLLTDRPVTEVPIAGIELPAVRVVLPVGHRSTVRTAIAHGRRDAAVLPPSLPDATRVVRGWRSLVAVASRFELPATEDGAALADAVVAARSEVALGARPSPVDDPAGFAVALGELARLDLLPLDGAGTDVAAELAAAVERFTPTPGWRCSVAVDAARRVLHATGEARAIRDLDRIVRGREPAARPPSPPAGPWCIPWLEEGLARHGALLPYGLPAAWRGESFEVFGVPVGPRSTLDYAVRWHGERPAVLWSVTGEPVELSAPRVDPRWRTTAVRGEALWGAPASTGREARLS